MEQGGIIRKIMDREENSCYRLNIHEPDPNAKIEIAVID